MVSGRKAKERRRGNSKLAAHKQHGKRLTTPFNSLSTSAVPWLRDTFPSLIWTCALLHEHGLESGTEIFTEVMERLKPYTPAEPAAVLDGSLASFDLIPEENRAAALRDLTADGLYEDAFPWLFVRALSKHIGVPGAWILEGRTGALPIVAQDAPEEFLAQVTLSAWHGHTAVATRAKMMVVRSYAYAGRIHISSQISVIDLFPRYPSGLNADERAQVEASTRAMFLAMWQLVPGMDEPGYVDPRAVWAESFWRQNWALYGCAIALPEEENGVNDPTDNTTDDTAEDTTEDSDGEPPWTAEREASMKRVDDIKHRFIDAAFSADPNLYRPDRHEVLSGLVNRQIRAVEVMASMPLLWSIEQGAPLVRSLVEARILTKWLLHKDDESLYERFKDYGRGHLKLHVLHLRDYADAAKGDTADIDAEIAELEEILERDIMEEFQDIDVNARFVSEDTRKMAYAVGLTREYRLLFAPMSANVHGEWIPLEQYALDFCRNPLHRGHRLPNPDPRLSLSPVHVSLAIDQLAMMVDEYVEGIGREAGTGGADPDPDPAPQTQ